MASLLGYIWVGVFNRAFECQAESLTGTWHKPGEIYDPKKVHGNIQYTAEDDKAIDDWISGMSTLIFLSIGLFLTRT